MVETCIVPDSSRTGSVTPYFSVFSHETRACFDFGRFPVQFLIVSRVLRSKASHSSTRSHKFETVILKTLEHTWYLSVSPSGTLMVTPWGSLSWVVLQQEVCDLYLDTPENLAVVRNIDEDVWTDLSCSTNCFIPSTAAPLWLLEPGTSSSHPSGHWKVEKERTFRHDDRHLTGIQLSQY